MQTGKLVTTIDHLVVIAANLDQGVAYCEERLGVAMQPGGKHERMGTHNRLLKLGRDIYMEVIAIDPAAPVPILRRWFGMDDQLQRERVAKRPFLATFVAATNDISRAVAASHVHGRVHEMQRAQFRWKISVRDDGALLEHGAVPPLIEWPEGVHPAHALPESGCELECLEVHHQDATRVHAAWQAIGLDEGSGLKMLASAGAESTLVARIRTPDGIRTLD